MNFNYSTLISTDLSVFKFWPTYYNIESVYRSTIADCFSVENIGTFMKISHTNSNSCTKHHELFGRNIRFVLCQIIGMQNDFKLVETMVERRSIQKKSVKKLPKYSCIFSIWGRFHRLWVDWSAQLIKSVPSTCIYIYTLVQ